jgi:hypothetical protein
MHHVRTKNMSNTLFAAPGNETPEIFHKVNELETPPAAMLTNPSYMEKEG